jgi:hypothetical protein
MTAPGPAHPQPLRKTAGGQDAVFICEQKAKWANQWRAVANVLEAVMEEYIIMDGVGALASVSRPARGRSNDERKQ